MNGLAVMIIWSALLIASAPYVRYIKHPQQKFFAAYLIFVSVFSVAAFALFTVLSGLGSTLFGPEALDTTVGAALLIIATVAPAAWIATLFARKPPRDAPVI